MRWISSTTLASNELSSCRNSWPEIATTDATVATTAATTTTTTTQLLALALALALAFALSVHQHHLRQILRQAAVAAYWQIRTRPALGRSAVLPRDGLGEMGEAWKGRTRSIWLYYG